MMMTSLIGFMVQSSRADKRGGMLEWTVSDDRRERAQPSTSEDASLLRGPCALCSHCHCRPVTHASPVPPPRPCISINLPFFSASYSSPLCTFCFPEVEYVLAGDAVARPRGFFWHHDKLHDLACAGQAATSDPGVDGHGADAR